MANAVLLCELVAVLQMLYVIRNKVAVKYTVKYTVKSPKLSTCSTYNILM